MLYGFVSRHLNHYYTCWGRHYVLVTAPHISHRARDKFQCLSRDLFQSLLTPLYTIYDIILYNILIYLCIYASGLFRFNCYYCVIERIHKLVMSKGRPRTTIWHFWYWTWYWSWYWSCWINLIGPGLGFVESVLVLVLAL